jgi:hypothetical protein
MEILYIKGGVMHLYHIYFLVMICLFIFYSITCCALFFCSFENLSPASRHALVLHVVETKGCEWSKRNWLVHDHEGIFRDGSNYLFVILEDHDTTKCASIRKFLYSNWSQFVMLALDMSCPIHRFLVKSLAWYFRSKLNSYDFSSNSIASMSKKGKQGII